MISGLIRFILIFIIGYIIFSFVSFVVRALIRALSVPERPRENPERHGAGARRNGEGGKGTVIELDRDQYKVE